ncbi:MULTISPECIES: hypothetical protein [Burkholderia]|uniref:hypothetical protein n=1 Tax=Burkholderia TaxID=32008 RepID=UPI00075D1EEF|nr:MULTISPECIES: hypothetical protein [Burkholderia]AOJ69970.1 hypothetical protein WS78_15240 [Burkholderia savannae]KVG44038.1 hypothetical protein WS77_10850 [Burkholderia sp. MSMB0265]KVG83938.1 hypothetical protein WS81_07735 [Burkholderia sp. MSMB2040]KVG94972.1 hypothetical protein WS82_06240 [Burkholderia sp. MSMB2041]KVH00689.1 hypothetical protein WS83_22320 [Burkholderia sp. MSMB2042]
MDAAFGPLFFARLVRPRTIARRRRSHGDASSYEAPPPDFHRTRNTPHRRIARERLPLVSSAICEISVARRRVTSRSCHLRDNRFDPNQTM